VKIPMLLAGIVDRLPVDLQERVWILSQKAHVGMANTKVRRRFFESLRAEILSIRLPSTASRWREYYTTPVKDHLSTGIPPAGWQPKQEVFNQILSELQPKTVLDLGCNTGTYARLAASHGARIIACDDDPACAGQCYEEAQQANLDILPLVLNVLNLTSTMGWGARPFPSAVERFRSELVLALALVHHLVARQRMDIGRIMEICYALSNRWLLIEFVPPIETEDRINLTPILGRLYP